jgi:hypothetical protein
MGVSRERATESSPRSSPRECTSARQAKVQARWWPHEHHLEGERGTGRHHGHQHPPRPATPTLKLNDAPFLGGEVFKRVGERDGEERRRRKKRRRREGATTTTTRGVVGGGRERGPRSPRGVARPARPARHISKESSGKSSTLSRQRSIRRLMPSTISSGAKEGKRPHDPLLLLAAAPESFGALGERQERARKGGHAHLAGPLLQPRPTATPLRSSGSNADERRGRPSGAQSSPSRGPTARPGRKAAYPRRRE